MGTWVLINGTWYKSPALIAFNEAVALVFSEEFDDALLHFSSIRFDVR